MSRDSDNLEPAEVPPSLEHLLQSLGASESDVHEALATASAATLALELALGDGTPWLSGEEAARRMGISDEEFARIWQELGFPAPVRAEPRVPPALADALQVVAGASNPVLGEETGAGLLRVIGASASRLAEAVVDAFRGNFEAPQLASGTDYTAILETSVTLARGAMPALDSLISTALRAHMVRVSASPWTPDEELRVTRRPFLVGFADLVGYTALSRTMPPSELAKMLEAFESIASGLISAGGGRVVKTLGDGVMFVSDEVEAGCAIALSLAERVGDDEATPPVRVGCAWGEVVSRFGDYFGDVVNLAARLAAMARPSTVVVSREVVARAAHSEFVFKRLPPRAVKGFRAPPAAFRLVPPSSSIR